MFDPTLCAVRRLELFCYHI